MADIAHSEVASNARIKEDRVLLLAFHRGNDAAARALWERNAGLLWVYARSLVGEAAADDVVQAVFLGVLRLKRSQIRSVRDPSAWLCTLTRHASLNIRRAAKRSSEREAKASARVPKQGQTYDDLHTLLERLPVQWREAVVLRHAYGFTLERLAEALGVSRSVAADRYAKGLAQARESVETPVRIGGAQHVG